MRQSNFFVEKRNRAIDKVREALAIELAQDYPDITNPPEEFSQEPKNEALTQLEAAWRDALTSA